MEIDSFLRRLLELEIAFLVPLVVLVPVLAAETAPFWMYEIFGALLAATITTFGLREMKQMTGD